LQLRLHDDIIKLKKELSNEDSDKRHNVTLTYITGRGPWYHISWKGQNERSGGLVTNIGIHFFDMLIWLFGPVEEVTVKESTQSTVSGELILQNADVKWLLSVDIDRLPFKAVPGSRTTFRQIIIDGSELEFTGGFANLHTRSYEEILKGNGYRTTDVRASIELVSRIRNLLSR
jgi:UDP-N-acetyl-2-amino-2-deoxyglucuronate dehydrogenase